MAEAPKETPEQAYQRKLLALAGSTSRTWKQGEDGRTLQDERVDFVLEHMETGRYLSGVTDRLFANAWGIGREMVQRIAREASAIQRRRLRESPEDRAAARAKVIATFERIAYQAEQLGSKGDVRALEVARRASCTYAEYLGIAPAKQLEVSDGKSPFKGWSDAEKKDYALTGKVPERMAKRAIAYAAEADAEDPPVE